MEKKLRKSRFGRTLIIIGLIFIIIGGIVIKNSSSKNTSNSSYFWENKSMEEITDLTTKKDSIHPHEVRNIHIALEAANIAFKTGNEFAIETRNIDKDALTFGISDTTLVIQNNLSLSKIGFFKNEPKILITMPENISVDNLYIKLSAGNLRGSSSTIQANTATIIVGAGNLEFEKIISQNTEIKCGLGNVAIKGSFLKNTKAEVGLGNISLGIQGEETDFSHNASVGLGEISIGKTKIAGIKENSAEANKENHLDLRCGMGSIQVKFNQ